MRLLALALLFPAISFSASNWDKLNDAYGNADKNMDDKYQKVLSMYPETKPQLEKAHNAFINSAKADCDFYASLKKNNLSRNSTKACLSEAYSNRENLYNTITINGN